jgi:hypothetical protein
MKRGAGADMGDFAGARAGYANPQERENATATKPRLSQPGEFAKRPSVPERPGDTLKRLAAKSRRWRWA